MKRKINPKLFLIKKQQKLIASRLMQISLRVDDYIYKNIPIPVKNAALFIKEVIGYKDKCFEDKRSLQVIEKLVRCMKGIIAEQHEVQQGFNSAKIDDFTLVDVESILASPLVENTPSIDEDLTQFTQEIHVNKILRRPTSHVEVLDLTDDRIYTHKRIEVNKNEITGYCNEGLNKKNMEDQIENVNKKERRSNEHLQRAISNLTIRGEDDSLSITQFHYADCSQSILNDFDCFNNIDKRVRANINKIVHSQDFEEDIQPVTITKKSFNAREVGNVHQTHTSIAKSRNKTKLSKTANNIRDVVNKTASSIENCDKNKNIDKVLRANINKIVQGQDFEEDIHPVTITKKSSNARELGNVHRTCTSIAKTRNNAKLPKTANNISDVLNKTASSIENNKNIDKEKRKRKRGPKVNQKCDVNVHENEPISPIKKKPNKNKFGKQNVIKAMAPENKLKTSTKMKKHESSKTLKPNETSDKILADSSHLVSKNPALNTIYNKHVENDLSWIENIRYVREIAVEENIPAYFEDSFWENYTLPGDWNDDDFNYS